MVRSGAMADVLELLIAERDRLDQAIAVLQGPRRRGRPPGSGPEQVGVVDVLSKRAPECG